MFNIHCIIVLYNIMFLLYASVVNRPIVYIQCSVGRPKPIQADDW